MLNRDVTFGQLREMLETAKEMGITLSENPLSDAAYAEATKNVPDDMYWFDVTEEELREIEAARLSEDTTFYLTTDEEETEVRGLVKEEDDTMFMRRDKEWVKVNPGDEIAELDDLPLVQVFGDVTPFWDSLAQPYGKRLEEFEPYL